MFKKLVVLKLFAGLLQGIITAFHPVTENNHVLVGHVFQQLYTRDWFNCIQACHDEPRCISYNYERPAGANGLCELNDCGVEDLCDRDKPLTYLMGFVFQQIRQSTKEKICSLDKSAPPASPKNVTMVNKTSTSLFIKWDATPDNNQKYGNILGYMVNYTLTRDARKVHIMVICAAMVHVNLTGLRKFRNYSITVLSFNQHGVGSPSDILVVRTEEDSPSAPPRNVRAVNKTIHSIGVKWGEVPENHRNSDIKGYTIRYHSVKSGEPSRETSIDAPTSFATLENLTINTNYSIAVLASNQHGNGPPSVPTFVTTSNGSDFQCPEGNGNRWFKDPDSCYHYFRCDSSSALMGRYCSEGKEFNSSSDGVDPCQDPGKPYCHV